MREKFNLIMVLVLSILISSTLFGQLTQINEPNMVSEAEIFEDENGTMYSTLVTFRFKHKMVDLRQGEVNVKESIILYPDFRQLLNSLRSSFGDFSILKTVENAQWGDTLGVNKRTNETVRVNDLSQIYRIIFNSPVPTEKVVNILQTDTNVEYAEGPIVAYLTVSPNDPWYLDQNYRWSFDVINAEGAWDITKGSPLIGIGINDRFGVLAQSPLHQDLGSKVVWHNLSIFGDHGITVAGVAGALTNNGIDIASLGWNLSLLLHMWGVNGIYNLVRYGADIINFSWITTYPSPSLEDAIEYALQYGRVCVASAGNDNPTPPRVLYPAAFNYADLGQVIAVSGTQMIDDIEQFIPGFNYSPGTDPINDPTNAFIDFSAPGTNYRALSGVAPTGTVHIFSGTSISAPFVSALVGLMLSVNSTLTPAQVYDIIKSTTDQIGIRSYSSIGWNQYLGYGRIDAANAVNVATGAPAKPRNLNVEPDVNNHPYLTWDANLEPDLSGYRVYKKLTLSGGGTTTTYVFTTFTNYTDTDFIITNPHFGTDQAEYWIVAVNNSNQLSVESEHVGSSGQSIIQWKLGENTENNFTITDYNLYQNYPNPFNPTTTIDYSIKQDGLVSLRVYDVLGSEVVSLVNENQVAGNYSVGFNAEQLPSGIYIYRLTSGNFTASKKLILMK